jgi:hypothetical protein
VAIESRTGPEAKQIGSIYRIVCLKCGRETKHKVITSAEYSDYYEEPGFSINGWEEYQVIECLGCESI